MGTSTDTDDIESFWEGLRPPRDPSTFTNVPVVDVVALEDPVYLLEEPVDGAVYFDYQGERCVG